jgi:type I restriction enzyme, S subunit
MTEQNQNTTAYHINPDNLVQDKKPMSEWKETKLHEIVIDPITYGVVQPGAEDKDGVFLIRGGDVQNGRISNNLRTISKKLSVQFSRTILFGGELIISLVGNPGEVAIIPSYLKGSNLARQVGLIRLSNEINNQFLYYYLKSSIGKGKMKELTMGSVQQVINLKDLKNLIVSYPTSIEQRAIASILGSLDDKIDLLHRQNQTLEKMAETLFRQWFVEVAKEDWEEDVLRNYVSVVDNRGKTPPNNDIPTEYPLIEANALNGEGRLINYSVVKKYVTRNTFNNWFRDKLIKYDSLITTVGANIGTLAMFVIESGNIAQNIIGISANKISPFYLYQILKYKENEIFQMDIGGVQPSIKVPHLLSLEIPIPPTELQKEFDIQIINFVFKMETNYKQIRTLSTLRDTLLPKLMSGEIRVEM